MARRLAALVLGALLGAGCDFPRDSEDTLERVRGGEMRVGVTDNPPWVRLSGDKVEGIEPALIEAWAQGLSARVRWVRGAEAELVEALHRRELDALALGLEEGTPWASRLGLTQPYLRTEIRIGLPPGATAPEEWDGQQVAVDPARPALAASVRSEGAAPVPPGPAGLPVAGYDFELEGSGLSPTETVLGEEKHVLAVLAGESAFLLSLDRFLLARGEQEMKRLAADEARP